MEPTATSPSHPSKSVKRSQARTKPPGKRRAILLVEDDDIYCELVHRRLDKSYEVVDARTGAQALRLAADQHFDCVLLDHRLPDLEGLSLVPRLLEHDLAVVMLTGQGSESVAAEAIKQGCRDYLVKRTVTESLLMRTVDSAIERHELEERLAAQREDMEAFVHTAAHDIKAPLRHMEGFGAQAIKAIREDRNDDALEMLEVVGVAAKGLSGMVDALLDYTRIGGGNREIQEIDLGETVGTILAVFDQTIRDAGGHVEVGSLPRVQGDPPLIREVLQNLIGNALKFRGTDPIRVGVVARDEGDSWCVAVSDNGIGIPPEHHAQVLKPLRRLHSQSKYEGYGLGLSVCQRIIEKHGGEIRVESTPGQGSTFSFTLPKDAPTS